MERDYKNIWARLEVVDNFGRKYTGHVTFSKRNKGWSRRAFLIYPKESNAPISFLEVYTWFDPKSKSLVCRIKRPNMGTSGELILKVAPLRIKEKRRASDQGWKIRVYRIQQPVK